VDYSLVSISLPEIICIESFGDYLRIQLANQKSITVRMTMKGIIEKLPPNDFVRVHRSFILPLHKIKAVRNKIIYIDSLEIPIGNNYEEYFYSIYKR
jgi:DNA-binding LytR/AlgR family response regulator